MKKIQPIFAAIVLSIACSYLVLAQQPAQAPPQPMSFFITSAGSGHGANLGGLAGADKICQTLAAAAGSSAAVLIKLRLFKVNPLNELNLNLTGPPRSRRGQ